MSFTYRKLHSGYYEVIMKPGTVWRSKKERRFALCSHENDAETIVEVLNDAEKNGTLKA